MTSALQTAALALSLLTIVLRAASFRRARSLAATLADLSLLAATGCVLAGVANPDAWSNALLYSPAAKAGPPPLDARIPSHLALVLACLASLPATVAKGAQGSRVLAAVMPGVLFAVATTGTLAFIGLRDAFALVAATAGAFSAGIALGALLRAAPVALRGRALLVLGAAVLAVASTLALFGHRTDPIPVKQDEASEQAGFGMAFRGLADSSSNPRHLLVEIQQGMRVREYRPTLEQVDSSTVRGHAAGELFRGPVVAALAWQEERAEAHPFAWLAKGDSLAVKDAMIRFMGFRMEQGEPIRFYADLDVRRAGGHATVSPGMAATSAGSTPFAAEIPGVGPVAVARMDADGGRVALMIAGLERKAGPSLATLRLQIRPGLEFAWGAALLALAGCLLAILAGEKPPAAVAVEHDAS